VYCVPPDCTALQAAHRQGQQQFRAAASSSHQQLSHTQVLHLLHALLQELKHFGVRKSTKDRIVGKYKTLQDDSGSIQRSPM
jgi:hypothetical protein